MAHQADDPFVDSDGKSENGIFQMDSEAAFSAAPLIANASHADSNATTTDPTFMQNQISIQRSPSTAISHASALSRKLSNKSNGSQERVGTSISGILKENSDQERIGRGRGRADSNSSLTEATNKCSLAKSASISTNGSAKSNKSIDSVREVQAVGSYPLGSLRVHSPSPTRETRTFLRSGDVFIVRDVPAGSLFGYDTRGFIVGPEKLDGLKDIPPGAHFIWGGSSATSLRNGFWIMTMKKASDEIGEVHVKRWDRENEILDDEFSAAEVMIQKQSVGEIFDKLQSYSISIANPATPTKLESHATSQMVEHDPNLWNHLTNCMKGALLTKITGEEWNQWHVSSTHDYKPTERYSRSPDEPLHKDRDEVLRFVFPKTTKTFSDDSAGRDRTEQALDTSSHIVAIIHSDCPFEDSDAIIGELQFCYITGMHLGNLACMEHWAHVVKVLFKAYKLALDMPGFFKKVIEAVHAQFIYDHEGVDGSILDQDPNLAEDLKMTLTIYKSRLNELLMAQGAKITPDQEAVGKAFEAFESWLWKWQWDLRGNYVRSGQFQLEDGEFIDAELKDFEAEDERGEYAPAIVELDEGGRERDLIRW